MISFACPTCGKKHAARDRNAGRRGFCECGAVLLVPGSGSEGQNQAPKLIGHLDLHSAERHARYTAIGGTVIGIAAIVAVVCALYSHNAWERGNRDRLLSLKTKAVALVQAKEYEKAKAKYDELFGLLGDRNVAGEYLKAEIESARLAATENNTKVQTIIAARVEADHQKQMRDAQEEAIRITRRPKERYYRDSHGTIVSETETENSLSQIRSDISSMQDNADRAFKEGVLRALEEEWARMKHQGPIEQ